MNQFLKRKQKEAKKQEEPVVEVSEHLIADEPTTEEVEALAEPLVTELNHVAYDLYYDEVAREFKAAEIRYNPVTGDCKITNTYQAPRQVGLVANNQKSALKTILKVK